MLDGQASFRSKTSMNSPGKRATSDRCLVCGGVDNLEWHEPAGRQNCSTVRVRLCRHCHARETFLFQKDHGFDLSRGRRSLLDKAWAIFLAIPHLIAEQIRSGRGDEDAATALDRGGVGFASLIEIMAEAVDEVEVRHPGPDPIANDRRAKRRKRTGPFWVVPSFSDSEDEDLDRAQFVGVINMLSEVATSLFVPMGDSTDLPSKWDEIAADPVRMYQTLMEWERDSALWSRAEEALQGVFHYIIEMLGQLSPREDLLTAWLGEMAGAARVSEALEVFLFAVARGDKAMAEAAIDTLTARCQRVDQAISPLPSAPIR